MSLSPLSEGDSTVFTHGGGVWTRFFWKKLSPVDAVGMPVQRLGPVLEVGEDPIRHPPIVFDRGRPWCIPLRAKRPCRDGSARRGSGISSFERRPPAARPPPARPPGRSCPPCRPRKTGCRMSPSAVHSLNLTSQIRRGATQVTGMLVCGSSANGDRGRDERRELGVDILQGCAR